jgi:DNA-binding NarL/FixJ family response regulator
MPATDLAQIVFAIVGADALTAAGIEAGLRGRSDLQLARDSSSVTVAVALVVADGIDDVALRLVRSERSAGRRPLLLVGHIEDGGLLAAVEAGVCGVVRRSQVTPAALAEAIRAVGGDEGTLPPDLLGRLLHQVGRLQRQVLAPRGLTVGGLTEREVAVLRLLAEGHDTAEVGRRLYFSERTVKNVIHDVTSRLELRNRSHAVAYAIREGLI